ncbi:MAG: cation-transporting P-type ATPase, partial [Coriobacteriia bacterium]
MSTPTPRDPAEIDARYLIDAPHTLEISDVLSRLETTDSGLTTQEADLRYENIGPNELPEGESRTILAMILDQFKDFLILLLLGAAVISGALGEVADTIAILIIVLLNAVIGVVQEYRAERAMEALREMSGTVASVRRDGHVV